MKIMFSILKSLIMPINLSHLEGSGEKAAPTSLHSGGPGRHGGLDLPDISSGWPASIALTTIFGIKWPVGATSYDKAARIAHLARDQGLTLKEAALQLDYLSAKDFDRRSIPIRWHIFLVDPRQNGLVSGSLHRGRV
jgi:hypothetical protein